MFAMPIISDLKKSDEHMASEIVVEGTCKKLRKHWTGDSCNYINQLVIK